MSLIDSDTGLSFGEGLSFQQGLGGPGLDIEPTGPPQLDFSKATNSMYVPVLAFSITILLASIAGGSNTLLMGV